MFTIRVLVLALPVMLKLWGNLTFNPVSALMHAMLDEICRFPLTRTLAHAMMSEAQEIASRLGIRFRVTIEKRIPGAEKVGATPIGTTSGKPTADA